MRNIPEDNLAYPVLIIINTGSNGSGFLLTTEEKMYFITAKHVLYDKSILRGDSAELICQTKELSDDSITKYLVDFKSCSILSHSSFDIAAIELGTLVKYKERKSFNINLLKGISQVEKGKSKNISIDSKHTKLIKDVLISNDVFLYGYPTSLGLKSSPQFDYNKPLLRKGIVANVNLSQSTIILDCPVYFGNSGGPVVEVEREGLKSYHKIIGVVTQFIPFVQQWHNPPTGLVNTEFLNSGYSVAVSMDKVFELIGLI